MADLNLKPKFHITGEKGWINDPNGLVKFKGKYHVFFQYYSHNVYWGPMHWGHAASSDLLHWEHLPVALSPDEQDDGCFSGTAIEWNGKLWLMYTSFKENGGGDNIRQLQALASSEDGVNFTKHGIVIGEKDLPSEYSPCDFRDPKIFLEDDTLYCLVAARKLDGKGRILLFSSKDIFNWKFECDVLNYDSGGIMIECPDFIRGLGLLTYCEQFQPAQGNKHLNIHSTFYRLGNLDCKTHKSNFGESEIIDYGFDFYAAQTFGDEPVMIGWLNMWDRNIPSEKYGFAGMLTVPRKVEIKNGELWQTPVISSQCLYKKAVQDRFTDNIKIGFIKINAKNLKDFNLYLRKKGSMFTRFYLKKREWVFDRSHSGEEIKGKETDADSLAGVRRMPFDNRVETEIIIVMDEFSVELFVNGKALSATIYPDIDADGLELELEADKCSVQRFDVL
ncbi:MAG: GH32 C-terminal domain-containing protein [Clostridia bacterium]|nr:GH32 C-terminal domain-containing protein [Clostridia bacterium]